MKQKMSLQLGLALVMFSALAQADVIRTEVNNGNLIMEDIPAIPQSVVADLNRYQNTRSAAFRGWDKDGEADGDFQPATSAEADAGWICYLSAEK